MTRVERLRSRVADRLEARGSYRRWVLITALVGMFSTTFPVTILTVSLGDIAREFGSSEALMTWVISAPMLASAVALPVLGKMGDLYGQRRVFLTGFALATVVAALTAAAWGPLALIGLRTLTQIIGAATQPTAMALIMAAFPSEDRVKAMGWWSLVGAGAPAVGLVVGGPLVEAVGWRPVFIIQACLAVLPVVAATLVLRETGGAREQGARFDLRGSLALAVAAGTLMFGLSQSAEWGWTNPAVLVPVAVAPLAAVAFVAVERRVAYPLLPLEFLRRRNFTAPIVSNLFAGSAYMGGFVLGPLLMRFVFEWSLSSVALLMLTRPLTYSLSSPLGGQLGARIGERRAAVGGTVLLAVSMVVFSVGSFATTVWLIGGALFLQGIANGIARPSLTATIANSVDEANLGIASATQRMLRQIGAALGISVLTAIYGGTNTPAAFGRTYIAAAVLATVAVAAATLVRSADRGAAAAAPEEEPAEAHAASRSPA